VTTPPTPPPEHGAPVPVGEPVPELLLPEVPDPPEAADPAGLADPAERSGPLGPLSGFRDPEARRAGIEETRRRSAELFVEFHDEELSQAVRDGARDSLVQLHLPLVEHCARRFRNRGEPLEDLVQVGTIGLIKSVDRFDAERGVEFSTYATPTIIGEIKRYFRDKGWAIRVPRRLQELRMQIGSATAQLTQDLGRSPTASELAAHLDVSVEEVVEGIESSNAYSTLSLDATDDSEDGAASMLDALGEEDVNLEHVEIRESIRPLLEGLAAREKKILLLRFFKNMTQSQIAEEIGVSQMHVSRLLNRTLEQLRSSLQQAE
jgi:RNA polymerase sigma-B factor